MSKQSHYTALERMYRAAPINAFYLPRIQIRAGEATIEIDVKDEFFHAARAVHGSVYFKLLDDAAFFAANSLETECFVLTSSFNTYLLRPVASGSMRAEGKVVNQTRTQFVAESVVFDEQGRELGRGSGVFVRGRQPLVEAMGYPDVG